MINSYYANHANKIKTKNQSIKNYNYFRICGLGYSSIDFNENKLYKQNILTNT